MAETKVKNNELAFELFKQSGGTISNVDIAEQLKVSADTVRKWKSRYRWLQELEGIVESDTSKSVTKRKSVTKKTTSLRDKQYKLVVDALVEASTYSPALDLLIEVYLDAYIEYVKLREQGAAEEKNRKEVARLLGQLGLDGKNKELIKQSGTLLAKGDADDKQKEPDKEEPIVENSKLVSFRQRRQRG